jgi:hypothetical protein
MDEDWQAGLARWLAPYLEGLGNKTQRRMCPAYIAGLIGPGDHKSIQPGQLGLTPSLMIAASFHQGRSVGQHPAGSHPVAPGKPTSWRRQGLADYRRHSPTQEGEDFGRGRPAICYGARQECELPDAGIVDTGLGRSATHAELAAVP